MSSQCQAASFSLHSAKSFGVNALKGRRVVYESGGMRNPACMGSLMGPRNEVDNCIVNLSTKTVNCRLA